MATVTYGVQSVKPEVTVTYSRSSANDERGPSLVALADGGIAVAFEIYVSATTRRIGLEYYSEEVVDSTLVPGSPNYRFPSAFAPGVNNVDPAITELSNGNILTTWTNPGTAPGIHYAIHNRPDGIAVRTDTLLPGTDGKHLLSDVTALSAGGFAVVAQYNLSASDQDAHLLIYDSTGALVTQRALGSGSSADERDPAIATLQGGNLAVAYVKELTDNSGQFGMAIEIWTPTGVIVRAPFLFDTTGSANLAPDIVALDDGGFAVAFQDDGYGPGDVGLNVCFFTAAGAFRGSVRADSTTAAEIEPAITRLANGFLSVAWTDGVSGNHDIRAALIDPIAMTRLVGFAPIETQSGDQEEPSIVGRADGTFVTAWTDANTALEDGNTNSNGTHISLQMDAFVRTTTGDSGNELLTSDELRDIFIGAGGNDTFVYAPGGNADLIIDFTENDRLDLTAFPTVHTLGDVLTRATQNGSDIVVDFGSGDTLTLQGVAKSNLGFDDFVGLVATPNDFGADGRSDILWRQNDGTVNLFTMNGATVVSTGTVRQVGNEWRVDDKNDFNGDGKADVVWRNTNDGTTNVYLMDGKTVLSDGNIRQVNLDWQIQDTADFNGDGRADILWRNGIDGSANIFLMDGRNIISDGTIRQVGNDWQIQRAGDFDGDGKADILWRNSIDGSANIFLMNGRSIVSDGTIRQVSTAYQVQDVADFNGDGSADILWRNSIDGTANIWMMNGRNILSDGNLSFSPNTDWKVQDTGDYNGDGKADILWRNEIDGITNVFLMHETSVLSSSNITTQLGNDWHIV